MTQLQPLHATMQGRPTPHRPAGLLVVSIDRLPAWMLSFSGATWMATPALDALAARGIVFDRVITPSLEVRDTLHDLAADPAGRSLFAAAKAAGWRSAVVTDDATVAAGMAAEGAAAGGDALRLVEAVGKERVEESEASTCVARLVDAAVDVIAAGEHRLVWCHVGSLGVAWDAPQPYRDRYVDPEDPPPPSGAGVPGFAVDAQTDPDLVVGVRHVFAGQVTLLDSQLGRLFAAVGQGGSTAESGNGKETQPGAWAVLVVEEPGEARAVPGCRGVDGDRLRRFALRLLPVIVEHRPERRAQVGRRDEPAMPLGRHPPGRIHEDRRHVDRFAVGKFLAAGSHPAVQPERQTTHPDDEHRPRTRLSLFSIAGLGRGAALP
ncbi:MAG: hypothetical protein ACKOHG_21185, partial [Planctomycetia bacterium]